MEEERIATEEIKRKASSGGQEGEAIKGAAASMIQYKDWEDGQHRL
jgi:hypothetical protein